jgi:hypothetical protein
MPRDGVSSHRKNEGNVSGNKVIGNYLTISELQIVFSKLSGLQNRGKWPLTVSEWEVIVHPCSRRCEWRLICAA